MAMTVETLSKNEKLTLYGLVRYPTYNDRRLSEEIKLKMSTVTAIRNRLKRDGYFRTVRVPYLERLGGELLVVAYTRLDVLKTREEMLKILKEVIGATDDVFYAFADQFGMLAFSFCRNYTDAWSDSERTHQMLAEKGALSPEFSRQHVALFPINQTRFFKFFDFSRILRTRFGLGLPDPEMQLSIRSEKAVPRHLSRIEKKVYYGLIRYPELVDNSVAKKIGVTRQSVTKIRKRFESEKLMATMRIPDFQKMGAEIIAMSYFDFSPSISFNARKKGIEWSIRELPAFFQVAGSREGMIVSLETKFEDLQKQLYEAARFYMDKGFFKEELKITMFSVKDLNIVKDFNFAPLVKKVLGIEDEKGT
jgi:DNA-binding MarR family transcriptional regulator